MTKYTLYRRVPVINNEQLHSMKDHGTKAEVKKLRKKLIKSSGTFWTKADFLIVKES